MADAEKPAPVEGAGGEQKLSKNELKRRAKQEAKERAKAEKAAQQAAQQAGGGEKKEKAKKPKNAAADKNKGGGEQFSFPKTEEDILKYWDEIKAFETSLELSKGKPEFTFYDGPPFATGKPHYGHILAGTIKDVVCRYAHQTGHYVERKFGWDTHGLPVEYEIDKTHDIKGPKDVAAMGIDKYNELCRGIVMRYSSEWRSTVTRLGRWIDFDNDYKTLYPWFMESVWWVFGELFKKNLVYRGFRVMPFSTALATPLSNFEANQEFHETKDPWVIVNFPLEDEDGTLLIAWTTTPWTLPSNLALCVHPDMEYCKVKDNEKDTFYICMKSRVCGKGCLFSEKDKKADKFTIVDTFPGKTLVGKKYTPLFDYFVPQLKDSAWRIVSDTYVTDSDGVGIVHQAPAFGEDDYRVCMREKIVDSSFLPCPVDDSGCFMDVVSDFAGKPIKEADKDIIAHLKKKGRVVQQGTLMHRDAFCWRSGTQLLRKAVDSWFVKVTDIVPDLLKSNEATYWVPNHVKEGRFHNWLEQARDWNISRNRYWGTPIPIWVSEDYEEVVCVSSIKELEELSGVTGITDLHRDSIDHITIPSKQGKGDLKRITQVFDCWFESGSMPYASRHYPFEQRERFENTFPADFIAEGLDQTRGWFYTLTVLGTALFGKSPFKNLIVNGLVLASDGKKMSKRLKNYPDPTEVIDKYGSDALRCYLMNSPVVHADELCFSEAGVQGHLRDLFLPWLNSLRFFKQATEEYETAHGKPFKFDPTKICPATNITDTWVLAVAQDVLEFVHKEMKAYRLYTVIPKAFGFIDQLTNWYIRFNRKRLRGSSGDDEAKADAAVAIWALGEVLYVQSAMMSPFAPFFSEYAYLELRKHMTLPVSDEPVRDVSAMTVDEVADWLATVDLSEHSKVFKDNGIAGKDLLDLKPEDLQSMGMEAEDKQKAVLSRVKVLTDIKSDTKYKSIHFQMLPQPRDQYKDADIVRAFEVMKSVVNSGRIIRDRATKPAKYPVKALIIISKDQTKLDDAKRLQSYIVQELNVQDFTITTSEDEYNVQIKAVPNQRDLGKRLKGDARKVCDAVRSLSADQIEEFKTNGKLEVLGHELTQSDINLEYAVGAGTGSAELMANVDPSNPNMIVLLDTTTSVEMMMEGTAREVCSHVNKLRKEAGLSPQDEIVVHLACNTDHDETNLTQVLEKHQAKMGEDLRCEVAIGKPEAEALKTTTSDIGKAGAKVDIAIVKK